MSDLVAAFLIVIYFIGVLLLVLEVERLGRRVKKLEAQVGESER